jgi:hypothetical protein
LPETNIAKLQALLVLVNDDDSVDEDKLNDTAHLCRQFMVMKSMFLHLFLRCTTLLKSKKFSQDYRNVISEIVWAESCKTDNDELVNKIIAMCDLEYCRAEIRQYENINSLRTPLNIAKIGDKQLKSYLENRDVTRSISRTGRSVSVCFSLSASYSLLAILLMFHSRRCFI